VIENGLIFLVGGLTAFLIMYIFRKIFPVSRDLNHSKGESFQKQDQKSNQSAAVGLMSGPRDNQNVSAASLQILYDLNKSLDSTLDVFTIIDQALSSAISIMEGEKADYYRHQTDNNSLSLTRSIGRDSSEIEEINRNLYLGEIPGNLIWVLKHKKGILVANTGNDPLWEQIGDGSSQSSILAVPVLVDQQLTGIISLEHPEPDFYSREQEELLTAIAHQTGLAINNAQRFVEVAFLLNSLKAKQELQDKLFEHIPVGVLLLDNQFNILSGNQQGLDYVDVLQPDFERISISRLGEKTIQELVELSSEPLPIEVRKEIDSQEIFEVQLRKAQTIEGQYWILMIADVTEERGIMNRIRIQDRLATLGQFAAGITHDFNNILSAIMIYSDVLLRDSQLSENNRIKIDAIKEQSNRATDLISQILDFSRVQSVEQKPFDLIPFLEEIRELLTQILPDDIQIQVGINSSNENLPILGDPARMQQMIMNLALNSRDAMPEGGIIEILVELVDISEVDRLRYPGMDPGSWILLQVTDTGIGISQQDQSQMFEPFFTTKFDQGGTGLGLAQVYGIVKQHQGFIEVESSLGIGTTFNVFLPIFEGEIEDPPEPQLDVELDGGGDYLLIVEDDESLQKALGNLFEEHGFQVIQTVNGKQAFDIIKQIGDKISLVITDVVMPKLGGVELYWKTQKIFPEKKFIFITGHPSKIANNAIGQESYTRVLQKPFSMIDILSLTREIRDTDLSDSKGQMMMI